MKKFIAFGIFFMFFALSQANAINLYSDCNKVWSDFVLLRTSWLIIPLDGVAVPITSCSFTVNDFFKGQIQTFLEKKDNSGNFVTVAGPLTDNANYSNLPQGTYRVRYSWADYVKCGSGSATAFKNGINLGTLGTFLPTEYTSEVVVGSPAQSDNQWSWLNPSPIFAPSLFDPGDVIRIDASSCKNFDQYGIAIQEFWPGGALGNWRALNNNSWWISNTSNPLGIVDLRNLWDPSGNDPNWKFIPGNTYRVQVTISNSKCASWVDVNPLPTVTLCYPSWGCREGAALNKKEPSISPNPVSQKFKVNDIAFERVAFIKDELAIHDLAGRLVKNFDYVNDTEYDISNLSTGVYFVSILRDGHRIFSNKLMVSR